MDVDKQLKKLLFKNDLTVAQLARATGVSSKTLYQWVNGHKPRDLAQLKKVASYFKVSLDALVFGEIAQHELQEFFPEINAGIYEVILRKVKHIKEDV